MEILVKYEKATPWVVSELRHPMSHKEDEPPASLILGGEKEG